VSRLGVLLALMVGLLLWAHPAAAHDQLLASDPGRGAELAAAPDHVTLTFNEPVQASYSTVSVTSPDGVSRSDGRVTADGSSIVQALKPGGGGGTWRVAYGIVSGDGHRVQATYAFRVAGPDTATTAVVAPEEDDAGGAPWALAVGGVLAAGVVAGTAWRWARRPS
jgi:methionine-rich copper-binding protein CopC